MDFGAVLGGGALPSTNLNAFLQGYLGRYGTRPPLFKSVYEQSKFMERYYSAMLEYARKWFRNRLDPFKLCPSSIIFWFIIPPYSAIGLKFLGLRQLSIVWRQQIEPNETIYLMFKILDIRPPFPLMLLAMFSSFGLVVTDGANRLLQAATASGKSGVSFTKSLDPFSLTPKMSIFYPIYDDHVTLGFLTIDLRHVEISIKQALDPNDIAFSLIRFLDLYTPFPLQIAVMFLSVGLFFTGTIYHFALTAREEVVTQMKNGLRK